MAWKLWDEIPSAPAASGAAAEPGWQHLPPSLHTVWGSSWLQPTGFCELRNPEVPWDMQSKGSVGHAGSTWCLPGWQQGLLSVCPPCHTGGWSPAWPDQVGWEIFPKALQPSKHGTIQHRIILKVKIVYCCLCRNALTSPVLFLYLAAGSQA